MPGLVVCCPRKCGQDLLVSRKTRVNLITARICSSTSNCLLMRFSGRIPDAQSRLRFGFCLLAQRPPCSCGCLQKCSTVIKTNKHPSKHTRRQVVALPRLEQVFYLICGSAGIRVTSVGGVEERVTINGNGLTRNGSCSGNLRLTNK